MKSYDNIPIEPHAVEAGMNKWSCYELTKTDNKLRSANPLSMWQGKDEANDTLGVWESQQN